MKNIKEKNAKYFLAKLTDLAKLRIKISWVGLKNEFKFNKIGKNFKALMQIANLARQNERLAADNGAPAEIVFENQILAITNINSYIQVITDYLITLNTFWIMPEGFKKLSEILGSEGY